MQKELFVIKNEANEVVFKSNDSKSLIDYVNDVLSASFNVKTSIQELESILYSEKKLTLHVKEIKKHVDNHQRAFVMRFFAL